MLGRLAPKGLVTSAVGGALSADAEAGDAVDHVEAVPTRSCAHHDGDDDVGACACPGPAPSSAPAPAALTARSDARSGEIA